MNFYIVFCSSTVNILVVVECAAVFCSGTVNILVVVECAAVFCSGTVNILVVEVECRLYALHGLLLQVLERLRMC